MFIQVYLHKTTIGFDHFLEQALADGEFVLEVPGDAGGYAALRDGTVIENMFSAARDDANRWARRLVNRRPAKMLLASSNADPEERELMSSVSAALESAGVPHFVLTSKQYLSKRPPKAEDAASMMLVRKKVLGKFVYEPVERYSSLLNKYNEVIDMSHLYVLPEDYDRARTAIASIAQRI